MIYIDIEQNKQMLIFFKKNDLVYVSGDESSIVFRHQATTKTEINYFIVFFVCFPHGKHQDQHRDHLL